MQTTVVSGRVPTTLKERVDRKLHKKGLATRHVIEGAYRYLDEHDDVPWLEAPTGDNSVDALEKLDAIIASIPSGTPLDTMTPAELREELANRA